MSGSITPEPDPPPEDPVIIMSDSHNSVCPQCGANIWVRIGVTETFHCDCCQWTGKIARGRTVMESLGRP